jgi:hypothetical protein
MKFKQAYLEFNVGDLILADISASDGPKQTLCYVGEKTSRSLYLWQNYASGSYGALRPESKKYKYSWCVNNDDDATNFKVKADWDE